MSQSLPGIVALRCVRCDSLSSNLARRAQAGLSVQVLIPTTKISFTGVPLCEVSTEYDNRAYLQTVALSFTAIGLLDDSAPLAFIVQTVKGEAYLVGTKEQPFPVIKQKLSTGQPDSASAANSVEVSLTAPLALIPCTL